MKQITLETEIWNGLKKETILYSFFRNIFKSLKKEIEETAKRFFPSQPEEIFKLCTEMSWIALWNNAIVREYGQKAFSLRELSVYDPSIKLVGRPDLLLDIELENKNRQFLFEGKMGEWKGGWKYDDQSLQKYYSEISEQAEKYLEPLRGSLKEYNPTVILLVFDWMRSKNAIESAKKYIAEKIDGHTQFSALYTCGEYGVWVYGKIHK